MRSLYQFTWMLRKSMRNTVPNCFSQAARIRFPYPKGANLKALFKFHKEDYEEGHYASRIVTVPLLPSTVIV